MWLTSNYYPAREGLVQAIKEEQVESLWLTEKLGRPVVPWNELEPNGCS
jgi:8-hydroxy-5-deazaflavin:NADPH oxidoreductase